MLCRASLLVLVACAMPSQPAVVAPEPSGPASDEAARSRAVAHGPERAPVVEATAEPAEAPAVRGTEPAAEPTADAEVTPYHREDWPHWIDVDGDCQDTRTEVLIAEAEPGSIVFTDARHCKIASGRWHCAYTGRVITDPHELDVDHLIPLAHAHAAGGHAWSRARRTAFANELGDPNHLVAVVAGANRSKGARTIATWLPPDTAARCEYVAAWRAIATRWSLRMDADEAASAQAYAADCRDGRTPRLARESETTPPDPSERKGGCCKVCGVGKPCGDGCIARDKTCHQPPGCAC